MWRVVTVWRYISTICLIVFQKLPLRCFLPLEIRWYQWHHNVQLHWCQKKLLIYQWQKGGYHRLHDSEFLETEPSIMVELQIHSPVNVWIAKDSSPATDSEGLHCWISRLYKSITLACATDQETWKICRRYELAVMWGLWYIIMYLITFHYMIMYTCAFLWYVINGIHLVHYTI